MALDKLVDSTQLNIDLTAVANAIRTRGDTSGQLAFPSGFVSAVQAIPTGITPTGTKQISITENGTTTEDVAAYANAEIKVDVQGGSRTLQKLAEYVVTEDVSRIAITVTDQMRNCEILYIEMDALAHTNDWLYLVLNNGGVSASNNAYRNKAEIDSAFIALAPTSPPNLYNPWVLMFVGEGLPRTNVITVATLDTINLMLYSSTSVFSSGTVRIWGYV